MFLLIQHADSSGPLTHGFFKHWVCVPHGGEHYESYFSIFLYYYIKICNKYYSVYILNYISIIYLLLYVAKNVIAHLHGVFSKMGSQGKA